MDVSQSLSKLDFEQDPEKWQEQFGQWAADNDFKAGGLDVTSQVNLLYNTFQENLKGIYDAYEKDQSSLTTN
jgi:hypothetical protein